jgi:hypothetical protein
MTGVTIDIASGSPPATSQVHAAKPKPSNRAPHWRQGPRRRTGYRPAA